MNILKPSKQSLNRIVRVLQKGGVVICPTDTVYGFVADVGNKKAVDKIFKIKKRPKSKPLPIFVRDLKMAKQLAEIDERQMKILKNKWPGKFTFILQRKSPREVGSHTKLYGVDEKTIALRIPKYKFLNDLLKKIDKPLVQTSVNISGQPPLTKISDIIESIGGSDPPILIIDGGDLKKSNPSKIIDLTQNKIKILRK